MSEAIAYIPPSREPAEIAARLRGYIERNESHAQRHVEGEKDEPKIEFGYVKRFLTDVKRLEHQMRCFILFLAAQLIERGGVTPAPLSLFRRGEPDPTGPSAYVRRQDREMRLLASGKVRLSPFAITTPVFEQGYRRRKRRSSARAIYKMMPCDIQPVDARYLLARYGRLTSTLLRADVLAERLAGRALTVKLNAGLPLNSTSDRAGAGALSLRNNSTEQINNYTSGSSASEPSEAWIPVSTGIGGDNGAYSGEPSEARQSPTGRRANARPIGAVSNANLREIKNTALSATHRAGEAGAGGLTLKANPLYLDKLHSILAPEHLWDSAADMEDERDDLTALHWMAHEALIAAGFPTGPDPKLRLPDFARWREPDPPDVPQVRSL